MRSERFSHTTSELRPQQHHLRISKYPKPGPHARRQVRLSVGGAQTLVCYKDSPGGLDAHGWLTTTEPTDALILEIGTSRPIQGCQGHRGS